MNNPGSGSGATTETASGAAAATEVSAADAASSSSAAKWVLPASGSADAEAGSSAAGSNPAATADAGAQLFRQSCAGCHTVGGGAMTGPDLAGTVNWSATDLTAAVKRMQKQAGPLEDAQVEELVKFLADPTAKERLAAQEKKAAAALMAKMEKPSSSKGEDLFHGGLAFANGGTACVACHTISGRGGTMGPDLTHTFAKMGETALQSACEQASFKVMNAAYRDHKVTKQEAMHLTAYLKAVDENPPPASASGVPILGALAAAICLGGVGFLQRKRNGGTVRTRLARRR